MSDADLPPDTDFLGDFDSVEFSIADGDPGFIPGPEEPDYGQPDSTFLSDGSPFAGATQQIGDGTCVVCGEATFRPPGLTASGSKRRVPKHCDLHKPNARVQAQGSNLKGVESQLQRIQEELADDLRLMATLAGPLLPVTGMYVFEQADPFTIAIIKLAKNNTRILRVLHRAAQVAPIYTVAETIAGTAWAMQVDTKNADPHGTIGRRLGVSRAYDAVYGAQEQSNGQGPQSFTPPPKYMGVQ